jgi:uncharacterized membrane protein YoaK (UPF0700 family)
MADPQIQQIRDAGRAAIVLAFAGGFVDAVGYIVLFQVFTAHMSGNTVAMAVQFSRHDWADLLRRGLPIPMFLLGTGLGMFLNRALPRLGLRRTFSVVFGLEALLLVLFILLGAPVLLPGDHPLAFHGRYYVLLTLLPVAMGLQNGTVRKIGGGTIHTTYISGLLTSLMDEIVGYFFKPSRDPVSLHRIGLMSGVYAAYVTGAVLGGFAEVVWALSALLVPVGCLGGVILFDLRHPLLEKTD